MDEDLNESLGFSKEDLAKRKAWKNGIKWLDEEYPELKPSKYYLLVLDTKKLKIKHDAPVEAKVMLSDLFLRVFPEGMIAEM